MLLTLVLYLLCVSLLKAEKYRFFPLKLKQPNILTWSTIGIRLYILNLPPPPFPRSKKKSSQSFIQTLYHITMTRLPTYKTLQPNRGVTKRSSPVFFTNSSIVPTHTQEYTFMNNYYIYSLPKFLFTRPSSHFRSPPHLAFTHFTLILFFFVRPSVFVDV